MKARRTSKQRIVDEPEVRAALMARSWAERIGLPPGNYWEPTIARHAIKHWRELGADENAWALVEALYTLRLGLDMPEA